MKTSKEVFRDILITIRFVPDIDQQNQTVKGKDNTRDTENPRKGQVDVVVGFMVGQVGHPDNIDERQS